MPNAVGRMISAETQEVVAAAGMMGDQGAVLAGMAGTIRLGDCPGLPATTAALASVGATWGRGLDEAGASLSALAAFGASTMAGLKTVGG